ncbi:MAG: hypothetical protein OXH73_15220 [Caldilineaceae bacterium]|nr:hypothetical protein [Caldilineaceae bacterium]
MIRDSNSTFDELAARKGEEAAIQAGIEADPDAYELDADWFRHASPAREMMPHIRASSSWASSEDRTNFQLFVDESLVAHGRVSEKRDLFTVDSQLEETTRSFRTMRAAKNWAISQFDSKRNPALTPSGSNLRSSFAWISSNDREKFRLFVEGMLVAEGEILAGRRLVSLLSRLDGTRHSFPTMVEAKKWAIEHYRSVSLALEREFILDSQ